MFKMALHHHFEILLVFTGITAVGLLAYHVACTAVLTG